MQIYLVGGAVRDALLERDHPPPSAHTDRDWVVVGATPEAMVGRGYVPVGRDFPVFLHPTTREEYALARTERKTARGYHGFEFLTDPSVTLEEDLARRDLTINAMAIALEALAPDGSPQRDPATGTLRGLVDPYGGEQDLRAGLLRHVTDAFHEDPVRLLRMARFAARWPSFAVAPDTLALLRHMVEHGEIDHLVPERVWQELSRGLMERQPSRMLGLLRDCGALAVLLPELNRLWGVPQPPEHHPEVDTGLHLMLVLDQSARLGANLPTRFACLCHDLGKGTTPANVLPRHIGHEARSVALLHPLCDRWRVPNPCRELAEVVAREHGNIHRCQGFGAEALLRLLERCDALRKPARFRDALLACEADARGRTGREDEPYPQRALLERLLNAALAVPTQPLAQDAMARGLQGEAVGKVIHAARLQAVEAALQNAKQG
jgi:tRNA nucleotidyltransferase (CCA-adding enzyme)